MFSRIRLLVIGIGCMVAGPVLIYRYYASLPRLDELMKLTGEVRVGTGNRSTRRAVHEFPVLRFDNSRTEYKYLDWFPKAADVPALIQSGDMVTIWTDQRDRKWVWQIEKDGRLLVTYDEIRDAVVANQRFDLLIDIGVIAIGVGALVFLMRKKSNVSE